MGWFSKIFKKDQDDLEFNMDLNSINNVMNSDTTQRVNKSDEINRPGFDIYFQMVIDVEEAYWGDDGLLYQGEEDNRLIVSYERYNNRMNQGVCQHFGDEKCEMVAKAKGWHYTDFPVGTILDKKKKEPVLWYELQDALTKM